MALVYCYECGKQMSESAKACPHCGAPSRGAEKSATLTAKRKWDRKSMFLWSLALPPILYLFCEVLAATFYAAEAWEIGRAFWTFGRLFGFCYLVWAFPIAAIIAGHWTGSRRGRPNIGALIGFLAGWIGVLVYSLVVPLKPKDATIPTCPVAPPPPRLDRQQATFDAWADSQDQAERLR